MFGEGFWPAIGLLLVLLWLGSAVAGNTVHRVWAARLGSLAFVGHAMYLGSTMWVGGIEWIAVAMTAALVGGLVYGGSLIALPMLAAAYGGTLGRAVSGLRSWKAAQRQAADDRRRKREQEEYQRRSREEYERAAPERERQRQEEERRKAAAAQDARRRRDARAACELAYSRCAVEIGDRFSRQELERFPIGELGMADLQKHINRRAKMKGLKQGKLSPTTMKKEIVTLRTAWNWGVNMRFLSGKFPATGLTYPKFEDKPPFQTREEIERRIAAGGLKKKEIAELWDCLYLTLPDVEDILKQVDEKAIQPWVHPMCCMVAYTGARRSEMLRAFVTDIDLQNQTVLLRERKRAKGRATTRRVPLAPQLVDVLKAWLAIHPGGQHLFAQATVVARSKSTRKAATPITPDEAHDHLKRALADTKWNVMRGYHVFRHSFISLAASRGIDQRLIDEWVGHQTDEQRRRYRHLYPTTQQEAISRMFTK